MEAPKRTRTNARRLRKEMTPPEVWLWGVLRRRAAEGLRFRRQHPVGPFVLDFYCHAARLAVEVDGDLHGIGEHPARDARRDDWLAAQDIETLRIPATEVRDNLDGVYTTIVLAAKARLARC
jgi:very-short-patch-repair endonuclease